MVIEFKKNYKLKEKKKRKTNFDTSAQNRNDTIDRCLKVVVVAPACCCRRCCCVEIQF